MAKIVIPIQPEIDGSKIKSESVKIGSELVNSLRSAANKAGDALTTSMNNAANSIKGVFNKISPEIKASFTGAFAGFGAANLMSNAISGVTTSLNESIDAAKTYNSGLAELQAVTGVSGKGLEAMGQSARNLALKFGTEVNEQLSSFSGILSNFGPDLAKTPEALNSMTDSVNTLAKAGIMPANEAMGALNTVMNQFGIDAKDPIKAASEYARISNIMSASAAVGSASIQDTAESMKVTGTAAHLAGMTIEETAAAIQTMNLASLKGSEGGTVLRNVIGLLQKNSGEADKALSKIGLSTKQLGESLNKVGLGATMELLRKQMEQIKDPAEKNALLMQVFGDNTAGANVLMQNATGTMKDYEKGVTGTNDAVRQAGIIMDSYAEKQKRADAAVADLKLSIGEKLLPVVTGISQAIAWFVSHLEISIPIIGALGIAITLMTGKMVIAKVVAAGTAIATNAVAVAQGIATVATTGLTIAQGLLNAAFIASPIGWIVLGIGALVAGVILAYKHSETFRNIIDGLWQSIKGLATAVWDWTVKALEDLYNAISPVIMFFLKWLNIYGLLYQGIKTLYGYLRPLIDEYFPGLGKAIDAVIGTFIKIWDKIKGVGKAIAGFFSSTSDGEKKTAPLRKGMKGSGDAVDGFNKSLQKTETQLPKVDEKLDKTNKKLDENKGSTTKATESLDNYIKKLIGLEAGSEAFEKVFNQALNFLNVQDRAAKSTENLKKQLEGLSDKGIADMTKGINDAMSGISFGDSLVAGTGFDMVSAILGRPEALQAEIEKRNTILKESLDKGLITESEYKSKYQQMVDEQTKYYEENEKLKTEFIKSENQARIDEETKRAEERKIAEEADFEKRKEMAKGYTDFYMGALDILTTTEQQSFGERLKNLGLFLIETLQKVLIEKQVEILVNEVASKSWLGIISAALLIAVIQVAAQGAKALLGAEEGTDFSKSILAHKGKPGVKDSVLMAITPAERDYGILSDKALSVGSNREYAQLMNKGHSIEDVIISKYQNQLNDANIVNQLIKSNERLERIERANRDVAKRFISHSKVDVNAHNTVTVKFDKRRSWAS